MMRSRKLVLTAAILAAVPLVLTGCGGGGGGDASSGDSKTLTILDYYNEDPSKGIVQEVLDTCAAELDVTIKRETVPGKDLIQKVLQRSSSRTLPDVLMLDNPDVQQIAATGALSPLGDYGVDTSGFAQGVIDAATYEGEVYGLQPTANTLGLFYNKSLLEEAGIEPPTTWDELKAAAKALTSGDRYGLAFAAIATYEGAWQFLPFMWTNGDDEDDLETPEVAEALQLWTDLVDEGSVSSSAINWNQGDLKDQFIAGKAAMMINGPWNIPELKASGIEFGSVQVPIREAGQTPIAPLGGEQWTVPVTGDDAKQKVAAAFVECLAGDENQLFLAEKDSKVPTKTALQEEFIAAVPEMASFAEQVASARARTGELGEEWPKAATVIYNAIQLALTGKATPDEAFARAAKG